MYETDTMNNSSGCSSDGSGGGLIASFGLSWFDKQREKRRREHLKLEAEKQLQKIGEAQRAAAALAEDKNNETNNDTEQGGGVAGMFSNHALADDDDDEDSSWDPQETSLTDTVAASSSADTTTAETTAEALLQVANQKSKQIAYFMGKTNSFGEADVSKSGEGASGMLYLSDIDGICGDNCSTGITTKALEAEQKPKQTQAQTQAQTQTPSGDVFDDDDNERIPVRVTPVDGDDASPYILSQDQMNEISEHVLPETITYCRWRRLYGLGRDGDSFDGCLRIIGGEKRTLMVVRTTRGDIFGGYADAPWHTKHDSKTAKFYGSASSCLYSFSSTKTPNSASPESSPINVYRWTGKNRYIQVCDVSNKMLAFGGGGDKGSFGLCLQEDFQRGTTGHCDTFDNDPLCSGNRRTFDIVDLEFWEFQTGVF